MPSDIESLKEISATCAELKLLAQSAKQPFLNYLLTMAEVEAQRKLVQMSAENKS